MMNQDKIDRDNLAVATKYLVNALQSEGVDVRSMGFSCPGVR